MIEYNFGNGLVAAHLHVNPDGSEGGWVANTAFVAKSAYIGTDVWVFGNALVYGDAVVGGNAEVYDNAWVGGNKTTDKDNMVQSKTDNCTISPKDF